MNFRTERLNIKDLSLDFLEDIHRLHSLPEVDEFNTLGIPGTLEVSKALIISWLEKQNSNPRISYTFCVILSHTNEFIGLISINIGKPDYRIAEVWYKTDPVHWNKGYTTEALLAIIKFGFKDL